MTIEIAEIGVELSVGDPAKSATGAGATPAGPAAPPLTRSRIQALVAACVQKTLAVLQSRQAR